MKFFEVNCWKFLSRPKLKISKSENVDYEELVFKDYYIFCKKKTPGQIF